MPRTVLITPVAGASGTATITLTVTDANNAMATETFIVTVNAAPTISDVANVTIDENTQAGPLAVTIGDDLTAVASLTLSATSSNTALVPNANIQLAGTGAARTVLITPVADAIGAATITLTVTDASGLTATDTFTLTVNEVPEGENAFAAAVDRLVADPAFIEEVETAAAQPVIPRFASPSMAGMRRLFLAVNS